MKVIFLDIDGVLNGKHNSGWMAIDGRNVSWLNRLTEQSGADIVISSTWRYASMEFLRPLLKDCGVKGNIIDRTPIHLFDTTRGKEIAYWLANHNIDAFVILDNNDDMGKLADHLVRVDDSIGLSRADVFKALVILQR